MKLQLLLLFSLSGCSYVENLEKRVHQQNKNDGAVLNLAKENRELKSRIMGLELELKKSYVEPKKIDRKLSSENIKRFQNLEDTWQPDEIIFVAEIEFEREDFEKSSFFFQTLLKRFPDFKSIDDQLLFKAGRSFYQDGKNYKSAKEAFEKIIHEYPSSKYFLQSKLWLTLTYNKLGDKKNFKNDLVEFHEKYQNTPEWKILERNYEKIIKK
jgi:TolA-binding protein